MGGGGGGGVGEGGLRVISQGSHHMKPCKLPPQWESSPNSRTLSFFKLPSLPPRFLLRAIICFAKARPTMPCISLVIKAVSQRLLVVSYAMKPKWAGCNMCIELLVIIIIVYATLIMGGGEGGWGGGFEGDSPGFPPYETLQATLPVGNLSQQFS